MRKSEIELRITELRVELQNFEINPDQHEDAYRDLIDELGGEVTVAGIKFCASRILEELDPIAFRCGLNDYVDTLDVTEDEDYKAIELEIESLEEELAEIEEELAEVEK